MYLGYSVPITPAIKLNTTSLNCAIGILLIIIKTTCPPSGILLVYNGSLVLRLSVYEMYIPSPLNSP